MRNTIRAGDAFMIKNQFGRHLYVVISDPQKFHDIRFPEYVFLVMFSSREQYKEDVCVLKTHEHSFIHHDTVIVYKTPPAIFEPISALEKLEEDKLLEAKPRYTVSPTILEKIRNGYTKSRYQMDDITQFLFRQGIIK
jgi:hypothetical protein